MPIESILQMSCEQNEREKEHFAHLRLYGMFSLKMIGSAMFGATFNLVTRVGHP